MIYQDGAQIQQQPFNIVEAEKEEPMQIAPILGDPDL
jgi:hypothetical protein